jgi:hypothetical protein
MLLFERMRALYGFENVLTDLLLDRTRAERIADRIVEFDLGIIRNLSTRFPGIIHGLWFTDDWGTERDLFISTSLWNDFFKPRYARIFDAAHSAGWHVWMHCCGKINKILGDLISIGLDVINPQQPRVLGIEDIGRRFRGKICFESVCDIQKTLPFEDGPAIREEAQVLIDNWASESGGFIASDYGEGEGMGIELSKKEVMASGFLDADPWRQLAAE